jgi:hypothetical protein
VETRFPPSSSEKQLKNSGLHDHMECRINGKPITLVRCIHELLELNWHVQVKHTWQEENRSVDWLTNFSFSLNSFQIHVMETPSNGF